MTAEQVVHVLVGVRHRRFHTDETCSHLDRTESPVREIPRSMAEQHFELCRSCSGEHAEQLGCSKDFGPYRSLVQAAEESGP